MTPHIATDDIERLAQEAGFDLCGVCRAEELGSKSEYHLKGWLEESCRGTLEYMHRNLELRLDPSKIVEGGRSVIVCGVNYKNIYSVDNQCDGNARIASYALMRDYHKTIKKRLKSLLRAIQQIYPEVEGRPFTDSAPILEKELAVRAGLGWIGKQSLLITPQYGSFVLLGELVVDAEVDRYSIPLDRNGCGECRRCIDSCPAGAIGNNHTIDPQRCISARTVEGVEGVEGADRESGILAGWIFGCDSCQSCCPHNRTTPLASSPDFTPTITPPTPREWLSMSEEEFDSLTMGSPLRRSSLQRIKGFINK